MAATLSRCCAGQLYPGSRSPLPNPQTRTHIALHPTAPKLQSQAAAAGPGISAPPAQTAERAQAAVQQAAQPSLKIRFKLSGPPPAQAQAAPQPATGAVAGAPLDWFIAPAPLALYQAAAQPSPQ